MDYSPEKLTQIYKNESFSQGKHLVLYLPEITHQLRLKVNISTNLSFLVESPATFLGWKPPV